MNCHDFELNLLALARNQLVDAATRELSLAHSATCFRCAGRLAAERVLAGGVRAVVAEMSGTVAPAHVEEALLAAFRELAASGKTPAVRRLTNLRPFIGNSNWAYWKLAAAAAIVLAFVAATGLFWARSNLPIEGQKKQAVALPPATPAPESAKDRPETENHLANRQPQTRAPQRTRRRSSEAETVTEFYPLMEGEDLSSLEIVQVVRVELPGAALRAAGLAVGPEMSAEPIKADVALGYDGMARAIRFVR
ncbi:MAG: hypothetical protein ACREBG_05885 [Pyrinomonadaceae bacterium]